MSSGPYDHYGQQAYNNHMNQLSQLQAAQLQGAHIGAPVGNWVASQANAPQDVDPSKRILLIIDDEA